MADQKKTAAEYESAAVGDCDPPASATDDHATFTSSAGEVKDFGKSLEFLRRHAGGGEIQLHAIEPDPPPGQTRIETQTFPTEEGRRKFLEKWNGKRGIYFTVNPLKADAPRDRKPSKWHIKALAFVHVDSDPIGTEAPDAAEARIIADLNQFALRPTEVVFSGGGVQTYFKLKQPISVTADPMLKLNVKTGKLEPTNPEWHAEIARAEAPNIALAACFGGDSCHDICRIMRVPDTINLPNATKRAKGRKPRAATLRAIADFTYDLAEIQAAAEAGAPSSREADEVLSPELKARFDELLGRDAKVRRRWEGDKTGLNDVTRSGMDMSLTGLLKARGYSKAEIAAILRMWTHGKAGQEGERYTEKMFDTAAGDPEIGRLIAELNQRHFVATESGKTRVYEITKRRLRPDRPERTVVIASSFTDFRNRYLNRTVKIEGEDPEALGGFWLRHRHRREYETIAFAPGEDLERQVFNLWQGFTVEPKAGDWSLLQTHIHEVICGGDHRLSLYLTRWLARAVQQPWEQGEVIVVMRGRKGTGKGIFVNSFGSLWGQHYIALSNPQHLTGKFNAHMRDASVVFLDEAYWAGDKQGEAVLKQWATEPEVPIEHKGLDVIMCPNRTHIIMASNSEWVVPATFDERRFLVLDVGPQRKDDFDYFKEVSDQMETGGREAMLHELLNMDITDFQVRAVPQTKALLDQKLLSLDPLHKWWLQKLWDGRLLERHASWITESVPRDELWGHYIATMDKMSIRSQRSIQVQIGTFLKRVMPEGRWPLDRDALRERYREDGVRISERVNGWQFPELNVCRAKFVEAIGHEIEWPEAQSEDPRDY